MRGLLFTGPRPGRSLSVFAVPVVVSSTPQIPAVPPRSRKMPECRAAGTGQKIPAHGGEYRNVNAVLSKRPPPLQ